MARRDAVFGRDPLGFEQGEFREAHEDGIERAGFQTRLAAQFVAVAPGGGAFNEALEDAQSFWGQAGSLHKLKSTYIDIIVKRDFIP